MSYAKLSLLISIICIVYSIIYESVLLKHEAYNDFIYALGVVSNCVALSLIASCIFYFVTDYFPKKHQQDQVRNYIVSRLELLERIGRNAFRDIVNNNNPTKQEFMDSCDLNLFAHPKTIDKENQSPQNITNWFEYFEHMYRTETFIIEQLMMFESMIPIEVKLIFIELQKKHTIFSDSNSYKQIYNSDKSRRSIKVYANDIYSHIHFLVELKTNYNKTSKI